MEKTLIKDFSNLKNYPFSYYSLRNIRLMRLTEEKWEHLIFIMTKTYKTGLTEEDLNEVFSSSNINFVRNWLNKPNVENEVYPKYYLLTSQVNTEQMYVAIPDLQVDEETLMDEDFMGCNPEYIGLQEPDTEEDIDDVTVVNLTKFRYDEDKMWNKYEIPTYAIQKICKDVLDPDGTKDYYEIPESHALNELNRYVELTKKDEKVINDFLTDLKERMPEGFDIVWDEESCGSPFFSYCPAFGLPMDCVILRVYPKNLDRLKI